MIKVYLLLRNNKQSGPYSLEEIAQQQLKPQDLIWIEGKSAAWKYASEISELNAYLPEGGQADSGKNESTEHSAYLPKSDQINSSATPPQPKKIFVSLPANARQKKEEPVQQAARPVAPVSSEQLPETTPTVPSEKIPTRASEPKEKLVTKYSSTLEEKEEAYTEWVYKSKSRKNALAPEWIGGIAVIILLMMGSAAYYIKNRSADKVEIIQSTTADASAVEELTSTQPDPAPAELNQPAPVQEEPEATVPPVPVNTATQPATNMAPATASAKNTAPVKSVAAKQQSTQKPIAKPGSVASRETTGNTGVAMREEPKTQEPVTEEPAATSTAKTSKTSTPEGNATKQKKTFSEKVDGFFNKVIKAKKVEPGLPAGSPEPATTEKDRKAVRRGETSGADSESPKKDLTAGIQVTTIEPSNTWMQGVHGLKMKVENRNDVKVSNAAVEVRYLNDQNAVIEKKTIRLNSIAPGKQITLDIPDHRLADHATATLISAGN